MKYYVFEQARIKHFGIVGSYTEKLNNLPAIVACTDSYQKYMGEEFHVNGIVYADGTYLFGRSTYHKSSRTSRSYGRRGQTLYGSSCKHQLTLYYVSR